MRLEDIQLHEACQKGHLDKVKMLVENGSNLDSQNGRKQTALHLALEGEHPQVASFLMER